MRRLYPIQPVGDCLRHHRIGVVCGAIRPRCSCAGTIAATRYCVDHSGTSTSTSESVRSSNDHGCACSTDTSINPCIKPGTRSICRIDQHGNGCRLSNNVRDYCHPEKEWRGTGHACSLQADKNRR